jgi:hypothetical protein
LQRAWAQEGGAIPEFFSQSKLIKQQPMPFSSSEPSEKTQAPVTVGHSGARALWSMLALAGVTVGGLCFAWWHPEHTLWHFFVVTQVIPLFYLGLAWWTASRPSGNSEHV